MGSTHYVPLNHSQHPDIQQNPAEIKKYESGKLSLQTHAEFMYHTQQAQFTLQSQQASRGSPFCHIFPCHFFPFDFMHLVFENLIKNLVLLWIRIFKNLNEGSGNYITAP